MYRNFFIIFHIFQGDQIDKTVCVAFFQGEELKARIQKVFVGFHASLYPCPSSHNERQDMIKEICIRLHDLYLVIILSYTDEL